MQSSFKKIMKKQTHIEHLAYFHRQILQKISYLWLRIS